MTGSIEDEDGHHHDHEHQYSDISEEALRVKALESLLTDLGFLDPSAIDAAVDALEKRIGPQNGAKVVARAWTDPAFLAELRQDATAAVAAMGFAGWQGGHLRVVENSPSLHNLVTCTLCSCYPVALLGLPPIWYKSEAYRARSVIDPRGVLHEFGTIVPDHVHIRVWDSTAEQRYLVIPERPVGTESWTIDDLASLVTRDSMIGAEVLVPVKGHASRE